MVKNSKPVFQYRISNQPQHLVSLTSQQPLATGEHKLRVDFSYDGGGLGKGGTFTMFVDDKQVAQKKVEATIAIRFSLDETWDIGEDTGTPVDYATYDVPFKFNGEIKKITVDLKAASTTKADEQKLREGEKLAALARE